MTPASDLAAPTAQAPGGAPLARSPRLRKTLPAVAVAAAAFGVYGNSLGNEFVWDDLELIVQNKYLHDPGNLAQSFTRTFWPGGHYRPVTIATYILSHAASGLDPAWFRAVNVALHALVSLLVLRLAGALKLSPPAALGAALLFAVHPLHTEAVVWIVGRAELLATALATGALLLHLRRAEAPHPVLLPASLALFFLALLSKESAAPLPALVAVAEVARRRAEPAATRWRGALLSALPYGAVLLAALAARYAVVGQVEFEGDGGMPGVPRSMAALTGLEIHLHYWRLLVAPLGLKANYTNLDFPVPASPFEPAVLGAALFLVVVVALALRRVLSTGSVGGVSALWVVACLAPFLHLVPFGWLAGERFTYFASVGFVLLVAAAAQAHAGRPGLTKTTRSLGAAAACGALVACAALTVLRNRDWRDEVVFFEKMIEDDPGLPGPWLNYASALQRKGRYLEGSRAVQRALEIQRARGGQFPP